MSVVKYRFSDGQEATLRPFWRLQWRKVIVGGINNNNNDNNNNNNDKKGLLAFHRA